jgi:hypothetical protein
LPADRSALADQGREIAIPLARWADRELAALGRDTGSAAIAALSGSVLLAERAVANGFAIPGLQSAGGGCRLFPTVDDWVALNLARADDRDLLPALFEDGEVDGADDKSISEAMSRANAAPLVLRGREMGLAIAGVDETPPTQSTFDMCKGPSRDRNFARPLVIDLSGLWAGPLAGHLLKLAGAQVVKVESARRPDAMRDGDPQHFTTLNQGKDSVTVDLSQDSGRAELRSLLNRADIVIEAARPRALRQLGVDADSFVRERPGLAWMTITGHGPQGTAADSVGFGDDCGIAGGLGASLLAASGRAGFVGDAIADPLTGIRAAREAWNAWRDGEARRIGLSMSGIVASALAYERSLDSARFDAELRDWAANVGQPFSPITPRAVRDELHALGQDNARWLAC